PCALPISFVSINWVGAYRPHLIDIFRTCADAYCISVRGFLSFERDKKTDYCCKQRNRFDKRSDDKHGSLNTTCSFGLTSDTFHSASTDFTDTDTCTDSS